MMLLEALESIAKNGPQNELIGICAALDQFGGLASVTTEEWLDKTFAAWPEFSGNIAYPVPHESKEAKTAYDEATAEEMWRSGAYARARLRLLAFLIERAREEGV